MQNIYAKLAVWNKSNDPLEKLQGVYAVLALTLLVVAALTSLINASLGQAVLFYAAIAALTFIGNGVVWAVVRTFVVPYIEKRTPKQTTRKK